MLKSEGLTTDPCGTPLMTLQKSDLVLFTDSDTQKDRSRHANHH